jgi:hypothetical protein
VCLVGHLAVGAEHADEALREHRDERRADQERLDAHVDEARDRARRVVGVQRREHEVARERGLDRDLRGLEVADLADQDHVRVLAQDRAQPARNVRSTFAFTSIWPIPGSWISTGSSIVMMFLSVALIRASAP